MPIEQNFNISDLELVGLEQQEININDQDFVYIRLSIHSEGNTGTVIDMGAGAPAIFYQKYLFENSISELIVPTEKGTTNVFLDNPQQLANYIQTDGQNNPFIKVNELLSDNNIPNGNYTIRIDFLKQFQFENDDGLEKFIVKEISNSRKEIRLKLRYSQMNPEGPSSEIFNAIEEEFGGESVITKRL